MGSEKREVGSEKREAGCEKQEARSGKWEAEKFFFYQLCLQQLLFTNFVQNQSEKMYVLLYLLVNP